MKDRLVDTFRNFRTIMEKRSRLQLEIMACATTSFQRTKVAELAVVESNIIDMAVVLHRVYWVILEGGMLTPDDPVVMENYRK